MRIRITHALWMTHVAPPHLEIDFRSHFNRGKAGFLGTKTVFLSFSAYLSRLGD